MLSVDEQWEILARGAVDVVVEEDLRRRLTEYVAGKRGPLRVKAGFDPTRPDLHLGHCVLLQKMRQLQDAGHTIVFLVGDTTALVGDPTGQNEARPRLTPAQVQEAAATYQEQAFLVLDAARTEVRFNSEWLGAMTTLGVIELCAKATLARILERDDFSQRLAAERPIYLHETLYPLLQGYDSVALDADLELGGTDQLFNLNVGRDLMPRYGKRAQCVLTMPLLEGLDARMVDGRVVGKKMSKSADNYIGLTEPPGVMFRKAMQIDDAVIWRFYELISQRSLADIRALQNAGADPREVKRQFAAEIVTRFHGAAAAGQADTEFQNVYLGRQLPDDIPEITLPTAGESLWIAKAMSLAGLVASTSEGRRLLVQGGVELDGSRVSDEKLALPVGGRYLLRVGSKHRRFAYVTLTSAAS